MRNSIFLEWYLEIVQEASREEEDNINKMGDVGMGRDAAQDNIDKMGDVGMPEKTDYFGTALMGTFTAMSAASLASKISRSIASIFKAKQIKKVCANLKGPDRANCFQNVDNAALYRRVGILKNIAKTKCPQSNDADACKKHIQGQIESLFKARGNQ